MNITGVGTSGFNGTFVITSVPTVTTFTYFDPNSGLGASGAGVASVAAPGANQNGGAEFITITFTGVLANSPQPLMGLNVASLTFAGAPTGTITTTVPGSAGLTINTGGTVTLDNTSVNSLNRINDAVPVVLNGGALNFLGNASAASSETLGHALTLSSGNSTISAANQGARPRP